MAQDRKIYPRREDTQPTDKAIKIIKKAIQIKEIDVRSNYDLFEVTSYVQEVMPKAIHRVTSHIDSCSEIKSVIEWLILNEVV